MREITNPKHRNTLGYLVEYTHKYLAYLRKGGFELGWEEPVYQPKTVGKYTYILRGIRDKETGENRPLNDEEKKEIATIVWTALLDPKNQKPRKQ